VSNPWVQSITKILSGGDSALSDPVRAWCEECQNQTQHQILSTVHQEWLNEDHPHTVWNELQVVQCRGCENTGFRKLATDDDDVAWDGEKVVLRTSVDLYPQSTLDKRKPIANYYSLPPSVSRIYTQTVSAVNENLDVVAGIGLRAIVESVCNEKNASGGNLEKKIDDLVSKKLLPQQNAELLHRTRLLGNKSAHETRPLTADAMMAALEVVEHLLVTVYLIQQNEPKLSST